MSSKTRTTHSQRKPCGNAAHTRRSPSIDSLTTHYRLQAISRTVAPFESPHPTFGPIENFSTCRSRLVFTTSDRLDLTYIRRLHHAEMVALHVGAHYIPLADHSIPKIRTKVRSILQQPLRMPVWVWLRPWVGRQLADTVLAPDGKSFGSLDGVDLPGGVGGESVDGGLEMRQQPRRDLLGAGVRVAEEADLVEPPVQRNRKGLDNEWAWGVD